MVVERPQYINVNCLLLSFLVVFAFYTLIDYVFRLVVFSCYDSDSGDCGACGEACEKV
jgi:hypothetical protein